MNAHKPWTVVSQLRVTHVYKGQMGLDATKISEIVFLNRVQ